MKFPKANLEARSSERLGLDAIDEASSPGGLRPDTVRPGPTVEAVSGGTAEVAGLCQNPPTVSSLTALPGAVQLSTENPGTTNLVIMFPFISLKSSVLSVLIFNFKKIALVGLSLYRNKNFDQFFCLQQLCPVHLY